MKSTLPERPAVTSARPVQCDEARVEPFGFVEALIHRDVARDVEAAAAGDLADRDLGLGLRRAERRSTARASAIARRGEDRSIACVPPVLKTATDLTPAAAPRPDGAAGDRWRQSAAFAGGPRRQPCRLTARLNLTI